MTSPACLMAASRSLTAAIHLSSAAFSCLFSARETIPVGNRGFQSGFGHRQPLAQILQIGGVVLQGSVLLGNLAGLLDPRLVELLDIGFQPAVRLPLDAAEHAKRGHADKIEKRKKAVHGVGPFPGGRISNATFSIPASRTRSNTWITSPCRASVSPLMMMRTLGFAF